MPLQVSNCSKWIEEATSTTHMRAADAVITKTVAQASLLCNAEHYMQQNSNSTEIWVSRAPCVEHDAPVAITVTPYSDGKLILTLYTLHGCDVVVCDERPVRNNIIWRAFQRTNFSAARTAATLADVAGGSVHIDQCVFKHIPRADSSNLLECCAEFRRQEAYHALCSQVGLLYQRDGQDYEEEMFGNDGSTNSSEYEYFLNWLGERVNLREYKGYRGGLDVRRDLTGSQALVAITRTDTSHPLFEHSDRIQTSDGICEPDACQLVFHVSTMLPTTESDSQQVEKKKFLGNDNVMIVFQDSENCQFTEQAITSRMLFYIIAVWPEPAPPGTPAADRLYRFQAIHVKDLPAEREGEAFFSGGIRLTPETRTAFIEKLVQAIDAVWALPRLRFKLLRMRRDSLERLAVMANHHP